MKSIEIEYWTYPEGNDFTGIEEFVSSVDQSAFLTINKKRTDALGGGLYDLVITLTEDISVTELVKSYIQDGVKVLIGYSLKTLFDGLKDLFNKNSDLEPGINELIINYKDCKVTIYKLYYSSIEESIQNILERLCKFHLKNEDFFKTIKRIHVPIFNHQDMYNLCDFRVKLWVDEPIVSFTKTDYFNFWGISTINGKYVLDLNTEEIQKKKFYTQKGYDKLFDREFKKGNI